MSGRQRRIPYLKSECGWIEGLLRFSHEAMATTYGVMAVHEDERYARQAASAAFEEVDRLEQELSRFIESSDISRINNLRVGERAVVGPAAFECLEISRRLFEQTKGAFDITVGALLRCFRAENGEPREPGRKELAGALRRTGMDLLVLDQQEHAVEVLAEGVEVDLGGMGKGYAVDQMGKLLRQWGIDVALIHGGYSSVLALDGPAGMKGWPVSASHPVKGGPPLAKLLLQRRALGGSGLRKGRHIIDPRTGGPVSGKRAAWSGAVDAATADALSTAFMVMDPGQIEQYCLSHPGVSAMVILEREDERGRIIEEVRRFGDWRETA